MVEDTAPYFGFGFLALLAGWLQGWKCQWVERSVHHFGLDMKCLNNYLMD